MSIIASIGDASFVAEIARNGKGKKRISAVDDLQETLEYWCNKAIRLEMEELHRKNAAQPNPEIKATVRRKRTSKS